MTPSVETEGARTNARDVQQQFGRRLGDLILAEGLITADNLGQAVAEQMRSGQKLGPVLVKMGFLTEKQLAHFLSRQYKVSCVDIPDTIPGEIVKLVPAALAKKYEVVPVGRTASSLTLVMVDPANLSALDEVAFRTGLKVVPAIATPSAIQKAIDQHYSTPHGGALADMVGLVEAEADKHERSAAKNGQVDVRILRESAAEMPVVRLVNMILDEAIRRGASDIHIDPTENGLRVRLRTDGMLTEMMTPVKRIEAAVVSRIKIMADLDIAERRLPQDGRIKYRENGREVDFRVSSLPTVFGESLCLRLLDKNALKLDLSLLGLDDWTLNHFTKAIRSPNGLILITGPTGSGKTTTLYSALQTLNAPGTHIVTLEDPVEYNLPGINQVQVKEEIGLSFAAALRSFLRHDPNVILLGEMRDAETAQIAIRAALTGHLVLSTLHTNDTAQTIARLIDMGLPSFLVASSLRLIVAQRLARKVCLNCRQPYQVEEERLAQYGHVPAGRGTCTLYTSKGCDTCGMSGMKGRVALYEMMPVTPEIRDAIQASASPTELRQLARDQGMKTLREAGLVKAIGGITSLDEVLRVTAE